MNFSATQVMLLVLVLVCWRPFIWPILHAFAAVVSWHLLFVYAMFRHDAFDEIKWRNLPKAMWREFVSWLGCVPLNCSNDMFYWGGVFSWHVKPYNPEQKEPQQ